MGRSKQNATVSLRIPNSSLFLYFYFPVAVTSALIPFLNSLNGEFVFDDGPAVVTNSDVLGQTSIWNLFGNDFWGNSIVLAGSHKSYRPLTIFTFRLTNSLFGLAPLVFHLVNVLLHSMVSCLVFWLAARLKFKEYESLGATVLFAVHPVHCEAVSSIVGRADVLATFFVLLALALWDKYQSTLLTIFLTVLALLSKETGIVLPAIVILFDLFVVRRQKPIFFSHLILVMATVVLTMVRVQLTGLPSFSLADNPLVHEQSLAVCLMTKLFLPVFHLKLLVFPKDLCFDWSMGAIPLVKEVNDYRLWTSLAAYGASSVFVLRLFRKKECKQLFLVSFGVVAFLPASNIFIFVGFVAAERILYLPSVGFCLLSVLFLRNICQRLNCSLVHLLIVVCTVFASRTVRRNEDWKTEENLYSSAIGINPAKAYSNLGQVLAKNGDSQGATNAYHDALSFRSMAETWYNLGVLQSGMGNLSEAVFSYSQAIGIRQSFAAAYLNLGVVLMKQNKEKQAEKALSRCVRLDGSQSRNWKAHWEIQKSCFLHRGRIRLGHRLFDQAREDFEKISGEEKYRRTVVIALAEMEFKVGNLSSAETRLESFLKEDRLYVPAIILYSRVLAEQNDTDRAKAYLRNVLSLLPTCSGCLSELAILIADYESIEAEKLLEQAAQLSPTGSNLLNYAVILQKNENYEAAEKLYRRVFALEPNSLLAKENYEKLLRVKRRTAV